LDRVFDYEDKLDELIAKHRMIVASTYPLAATGPIELSTWREGINFGLPSVTENGMSRISEG